MSLTTLYSRRAIERVRSHRHSQVVEAGVGEGGASIGAVSGLPGRAPPGRFQMTVGVDLSPGIHDRFGVTNPDWCDTGLFTGGYRMTLRLLVDGNEQDSISKCFGNDGSVSVATLIQNPGVHTVTFRLEGTSSGNIVDEKTVDVFITDPNSSDGSNDDPSGTIGACISNTDCPQGQVCQNGQCVPSSGGLGLGGLLSGLGGSATNLLAIVGGGAFIVLLVAALI